MKTLVTIARHVHVDLFNFNGKWLEFDLAVSNQGRRFWIHSDTIPGRNHLAAVFQYVWDFWLHRELLIPVDHNDVSKWI